MLSSLLTAVTTSVTYLPAPQYWLNLAELYATPNLT